jgi:hypothetical protein
MIDYAEFETITKQREALDDVRNWRGDLEAKLQDPEALASECSVCALRLKHAIERCRKLIPDCEPHVFIDIAVLAVVDVLEDIAL